MVTTNKISVAIDETDYSKHIVFPVKWNDLLDERLDEARISLKAIQQEVFQPLLPVTITLTDFEGNTKQLDYVISSNFSKELPPGSGLYDHEFVLIEQTKILEGFLVDTMTFTNDLGRLYTNHAPIAQPVMSGDGKRIIESSGGENAGKLNEIDQFKTAMLPNHTITIPKAQDLVTGKTYLSQTLIFSRVSLTVTKNGNEIKTGDGLSELEINLELGSYEIKYSGQLFYGGAGGNVLNVSYYIQCITNTEPLPKWNIASVVDRVLSIAETRRLYQNPRFQLDPSQRERLAAINAPEFAFTSDTLKEVLDQIGGFIHAIPRLEGNKVHFDFLGETEMSNAANYKYVTNTYSQNVESYCTKLDSRADNLVNIIDDAQGVITDPFYDGYKTVRTENVYARIEDSNMIIETKYPIYDVKRLTCGIVPGQTYQGGDLTPYVFEEADYNRMSSTGGQYPNSKGYALYFTQGQNHIRGLNLKFPNAISEALENYSIVNILRNTSGHSDLNVTDYFGLAFQISYIPIYSARVEQSKSCMKGMKTPRTLAYNQGANLIETRYYGENMKGVIARLGNVDRLRTFMGRKLTSIPKVGQLFDEEYYISSVAVEFDPYDYKCTMELSKDFNRLSQYIGINSQKRYYEVSEKQAYEREINYSDYLVIGDSVSPFGTDAVTCFGDRGLNYITGIFVQSQSEVAPLTAVTALCGDSSGENGTVTLPLVRAAMGNSLVLSFSYEDNYSAGNQAVYSSAGSVSGYYQQGVQYSDVYGRTEVMHFDMYDGRTAPASYAEQLAEGTAIPAVGETGANNAPITTATSSFSSPFVIEKDSKEAISFNYQIEFVTNRPSIVIGSAMARNCWFAVGAQSGHGAKLYILPNRLSKFADVVDLTGATLIESYENTEKCKISNSQIIFDPVSSTAAGKSWALVDGATNELLIGENVSLAVGQTVPLPVMTPRHVIENL